MNIIFAGHGGAPHFAVAEADGRLLSAAGYIPRRESPRRGRLGVHLGGRQGAQRRRP